MAVEGTAAALEATVVFSVAMAAGSAAMDLAGTADLAVMGTMVEALALADMASIPVMATMVVTVTPIPATPTTVVTAIMLVASAISRRGALWADMGVCAFARSKCAGEIVPVR